MKDTTLTLENLQAIYAAMQAIDEKDKSEYFLDYYYEVVNLIAQEYLKRNKNEEI